MNYSELTKEQQAQEMKGRIKALEKRHYLRSLDLIEAQAVADATDLPQAKANVGQIMQDLRSIELSLRALV